MNNNSFSSFLPRPSSRRVRYLIFIAFCSLFSLDAGVSAQTPENKYVRRNLVSNRYDANDPTSPPFANIIDAKLIDPWGAAIRTAGLGGHFWIANTGSSSSSEFVGDVRDANGDFVPLYQDALKTVAVEGSPVAQAFSNSSTEFPVAGDFCFDDGEIVCRENAASHIGRFTKPSRFIIATEEGKIAAWSEQRDVKPFGRMRKFETVVDNSANNTLYRGLAISNREKGNWIYVANFAGDSVEIYDANWNRVVNAEKSGNAPQNFEPFRKPAQIPATYRPFNVQMIDNQIYVAYAQIILPKTSGYDAKDPFAERHCAGCGHVAVFDEFGRFVRILKSNKRLNAPWGFAVAPKDFGGLSDALLVGNFGDGTIAAFDRETGEPIDYLRDEKSRVIKIDGLWAIFFGNGASLGRANYLYWTAGYNDEKDGGFGSLNWTGAKNPNPK